MSEWQFPFDDNIDPKAATYPEKEGIIAEHVRDSLWQGADDTDEMIERSKTVLDGSWMRSE